MKWQHHIFLVRLVGQVFHFDPRTFSVSVIKFLRLAFRNNTIIEIPLTAVSRIN